MARKPGLGKGSAPLSRERDTRRRRGDDYQSEGHCAVCRCSRFVQSYQPRKAINDESLVALASSVKELGVLQPSCGPVDGEEGHYELIAGERRWRAAILAELEFMPFSFRLT